MSQSNDLSRIPALAFKVIRAYNWRMGIAVKGQRKIHAPAGKRRSPGRFVSDYAAQSQPWELLEFRTPWPGTMSERQSADAVHIVFAAEKVKAESLIATPVLAARLQMLLDTPEG